MYTPGEIRAAETLTSERDDWEDYWHYHAFRDDVKPLCQTILRHRADYGDACEELELTGPWLESVGGEADEHSMSYWFLITGHERLHVRVNGQWWLANSSTFGGQAGGHRHVRYRSQFRRLADAVGVTVLTPSSEP